jgi:hypothetical protein
MRIQDQFMLALTVWRENRGGGISGMQSVANVIANRAARRNTDAYTECVRPLQFSSITAKGDPELSFWPNDEDPQWQAALGIAGQAAVGALEDITHGATLYYAPLGQAWKARLKLPDGAVVKFPDDWDASAVEYAGTIASQLFFRQR